MFAVLLSEKSNNSFRSRIGELFGKREIDTQRVFYKNRVVYYKITVTSAKGKVPYRMIKNLSEKFRGRVLFEKNIPVPPGIKLNRNSDMEYETRLLYSKMIDTVKKLNIDPVKGSLCVFDSKGVLSDVIFQAVNYFSKINIVTDNKDAYNDASEAIIDKWGLTLTFTDKLYCINENAVIVSRRASDVPLIFKGTVFCNETVAAFDCNTVGYGEEDLPEDLRQIIPDGIDCGEFLGEMWGFNECRIAF